MWYSETVDGIAELTLPDRLSEALGGHPATGHGVADGNTGLIAHGWTSLLQGKQYSRATPT